MLQIPPISYYGTLRFGSINCGIFSDIHSNDNKHVLGTAANAVYVY